MHNKRQWLLRLTTTKTRRGREKAAEADQTNGEAAFIWIHGEEIKPILGEESNIDVFDLENDYYLVNFQYQEDYMEALTGVLK